MENKKVFAEAPVGIGRWGDVVDDDGDEYGRLPLPLRSVVGPDENGVTTTTEYRFDDDGKKIKVVNTTRDSKLAPTRLPKAAVVERRSWSKFGDALGSASLTYSSNEEIFLERPRAPVTLPRDEGTYVPPKRSAAMYTAGQPRAASLLVDNWSVDADEIDLHELFRPFGPLQGVSICRNMKTGKSKGMAVVNFMYKADAQTAIATLDGYGYDHLILQVNWA